MQIPLGPKELYCPMWRKPMSKVCHTCPLWVKVQMTNPNTGLHIDNWQCALSWAPYTQLEAANQTRITGEELKRQSEKLNEACAAMAKTQHVANELAAAAIIQRERLATSAPQVLEATDIPRSITDETRS